MKMNDVGGCMLPRELYRWFDRTKVDFRSSDVPQHKNDRHIRYIYGLILHDFLLLVLNDVIDNNVEFQLPLRRRKASIHAKLLDEDKFRKYRSELGWYKNVDYLRSNFTVPFIGLFDDYGRGKEHFTPIYLPYDLKQKMLLNVYDGKSYY